MIAAPEVVADARFIHSPGWSINHSAISSATDSDAYPYRFYNYEIIWTGSAVASGAGMVLKGTINSYHSATSTLGKGYPKQYTATNWPAETYEWQNGMIKK